MKELGRRLAALESRQPLPHRRVMIVAGDAPAPDDDPDVFVIRIVGMQPVWKDGRLVAPGEP